MCIQNSRENRICDCNHTRTLSPHLLICVTGQVYVICDSEKVVLFNRNFISKFRGTDFRTVFQTMKNLWARFPKAPVLAVTATLTEENKLYLALFTNGFHVEIYHWKVHLFSDHHTEL